MNAQLKKLQDELWSQAAAIVVNEDALIEDLAKRLAEKVKHLKLCYRLSETELETIEAQSTRFA